MSLLLEPSLVSRGRAALVAATEDDSVKGGAAANAGGDSCWLVCWCSSLARPGGK
jgi:hypothetical protein